MENKHILNKKVVDNRKKIVNYEEFESIIDNLTDYQFYGVAANLGILPKEKDSIEKISKDRPQIQKDLIDIYVALSRPSRRDILFLVKKINKNNRRTSTEAASEEDGENGEEN